MIIRIVESPLGQVDGMYLRFYSPDGGSGRGVIGVTSDASQALRFTDTADAFECWRSISATHPQQSDGKPNRPLTAFTIEMIKAP